MLMLMLLLILLNHQDQRLCVRSLSSSTARFGALIGNECASRQQPSRLCHIRVVCVLNERLGLATFAAAAHTRHGQRNHKEETQPGKLNVPSGRACV